MSKIDLFDSIFYIILGCIVCILTADFISDSAVVTPAFFPRGAASALILVNTIRLIQLFSMKKYKMKGEIGSNKAGIKSFITIFFALLLFFISNFLIGFFFSAVLFIFCSSHLLGEKKIVQNAIFAFLISGVISSVFKWILVLPLPQGLLF